MLLQLLNEKEVEFCVSDWNVKEDGAKSQPLSDQIQIKQNSETPEISDEIRKFISEKIYNF